MRIGDLLEFLDAPITIGWDVTPDYALQYLRAKGLRMGFSYADAVAEERASAFTIAKMMDTDLLGDVLKSLTDAAERGTPMEEWSKSIIPTLQQRGWWGRQPVLDPVTGRVVQAQTGSPSRLETIFRTNMGMAYAAGHWQQIAAQAEDAPYLMYDAVDDFRTRPLHAAWDGTVLPVNHPWWRTHHPLNGFNCRCGTIQLSAAELEEMGLKVTAVPAGGTYSWTNPRTGKVEKIPNGIDPGFNHNPGTERIGELKALAIEKAKTLPSDAAKAALAGLKATERAVEYSFDLTTPAGAWHGKAWDGAQPWMRPLLAREQAVNVTTQQGGAHAFGGQTINMPPSYSPTSVYNRSTWRHEFGHILDVRMGSRAATGSRAFGYVSSSEEFTSAMQRDARALAARTFVRDAKQAAKREEMQAAYASLQGTLVDMAGAGARQLYLADRAAALGVDLGGLRTALQANSAALFDTLAGDIRMARILEAIERGDAERFLAEAAGMAYGNPYGTGMSADERAMMWATVRESWRKGLLGHFADLIGASTRNKIAGINAGYPGHTEAYYRKRARYGQQTEAFANLTSLAGAPEGIWWDLVRRFMPSMAKTFEEMIRNAY